MYIIRLKELELLIFKRNSSRFPDHYIVLENKIEDSCLSCSIYICFFLSLGQLACPPGQVEQLYG
jgi:hypothetical protein